MGAAGTIFRARTSETKRRNFYRVCDKLGLDQSLVMPPSTKGESTRVGTALHIQQVEYDELMAAVEFFGTNRAVITRICYRIGMALFAETINELFVEEEDDAKEA